MRILQQAAQRYNLYKKKDFFYRVFQLTLFLWVFSIPLKNSLYQISTVLLVLLFFVHLFIAKQKNIVFETISIYRTLLITLGLFVVSMLLSSLMGISEQDGFLEIFKYFYRHLLVFFILLYFYHHGYFSKKWLLSIIFVTLCINALDGIYQYIAGIDFIADRLPDGPSYLLTGAVYQHNPFGLLMAMGAMMSLVLFFDKRHFTFLKGEKFIFFLALLAFLFTLFHSQSRSAWVMFGVFSIGFLFIYVKQNGIDKRLLYTVTSLLLVTIVFFLLDDNLSHRLALLLEGNSSGRTSQIWPFTIDKILHSPLFGYGIETYKLLGAPGGHAGVHNLTLELLLYTGLIGFFVFSIIVWLTLKESFSMDDAVYFVIFTSFIILLQFDGSLFDGKVHLNVFILLLFFIHSAKLDKTCQSDHASIK